MLNIKDIKKEFPIFNHQPNLVYLDSAASSQTPQSVIDVMDAYYEKYRANVHRGMYDISMQATEVYEAGRSTVAAFLNAWVEEIIFTSGATHGLNMLAAVLTKQLGEDDNVVLTRLEHHANLIPWQEMAKRQGFRLKFLELTKECQLDLDSAKSVIGKDTKIVSLAHASNSLGVVNPVKEIISLAKQVGAITIIDAAQSVPHIKINVKDLDCDFLVFSGHKMYGPTGVGVVYGKRERLEEMEPFLVGGDMITYVTYESAQWAEGPQKFEAGTPNIAGVIGLAEAVRFMESIGWEAIETHERELTAYLLKQLKPYASIVGPDNTKDRVGVVSFLVGDVHPHDVADILNRCQVAVRAGHHCTMPLMKHLGLSGTTRASLGIYNTTADVDVLVAGVKQVRKIFGVGV